MADSNVAKLVRRAPKIPSVFVSAAGDEYTVNGVRSLVQDAYARFYAGVPGQNPSEEMNRILRMFKKSDQKILLSALVDPGDRIRAKSAGVTVENLKHDLAHKMMAPGERMRAAAMAAEDARVTVPADKAIIRRPAAGGLVRTATGVEVVADSIPTAGPKLNYRVHRIADGAGRGVGGPGVYKGEIPASRALARVGAVDGGATATGAVETTGTLGKVGRFLGRNKGLLKWGGRALGALAIADLAMRAVDATQGREDRLRSQRALGTEADLGESALSLALNQEKVTGRLLGDAETFGRAAGTASVVGAQDAAAHQVQLELVKERNDLLGIAMRSEPSSTEYILAMRQFMGGR